MALGVLDYYVLDGLLADRQGGAGRFFYAWGVFLAVGFVVTLLMDHIRRGARLRSRS